MKTTLLVVAGMVAGLAIASWLQPSSEPSIEAKAANREASMADAGQRATLEALGENPARVPRALENPSNQLDPAPFAFIDSSRRAAAATPERLVIDLIVAGFAPDRAEWINRRTQELRMQAIQTQDEAKRDGRPPPPYLEATTLRTELGDQDYERFLAAQGRPTSINIVGVLASSPAERAGIQRGDEIVSYGGKRVFNVQELNELTLGGSGGESVVVDVRRDGENLRIVLPRGPIGVWGGGPAGFRGPPPGLQR